MKLFTSAVLLALSTLSVQASAATLCKIEITFGGFLDGAPCNVPAGSSLEVLTGYTQCHIPVVLDDKCNVVSADFSTCDQDDAKIVAFAKRGC